MYKNIPQAITDYRNVLKFVQITSWKFCSVCQRKKNMSDTILHTSSSLFRQETSSHEVPSRFSSLSSISVHKPLIHSNRFHFNNICFVFKQQESKVFREEDIDDVFDSSPVSVPLESISGESQFDELIRDTVVILWMAKWCRKCIYLKPKLEKLAADYYPRLRFYCVDVNAVPHKLVDRAGITKMPTIQLWEDGLKQAEVIGGHKAYMVVNEIRDIIEKESSSV